MRFYAFSKIITKISLYELPRLLVQLQIAPPYRELLLNQSTKLIDKAKLAAFRVLFYPESKGKTYLVFMLRRFALVYILNKLYFPAVSI